MSEIKENQNPKREYLVNIKSNAGTGKHFKEQFQLPKTFITIVTNKIKDYCQFDFITQLRLVLKKYPNFDYVIVDNSQTENNANELRSYGLKNVIWHYRQNVEQRILMAESNEIARQFAIKSGYDFRLSLESDIFFNDTVFPILVTVNKEIVCCPYFTGGLKNQIDQQTGNKALIFDKKLLIRKMFITDTDELNKIQNVEEKVLLFQQGCLSMNKQFELISSAGIGFMLIRKDVDTIPYRVDLEDKTSYADACYNKDLINSQAPVYMYNSTDIIYHHYQTPLGWEEISKLK